MRKIAVAGGAVTGGLTVAGSASAHGHATMNDLVEVGASSAMTWETCYCKNPGVFDNFPSQCRQATRFRGDRGTVIHDGDKKYEDSVEEGKDVGCNVNNRVRVIWDEVENDQAELSWIDQQDITVIQHR